MAENCLDLSDFSRLRLGAFQQTSDYRILITNFQKK